MHAYQLAFAGVGNNCILLLLMSAAYLQVACLWKAVSGLPSWACERDSSLSWLRRNFSGLGFIWFVWDVNEVCSKSGQVSTYQEDLC